MWLIAGNAQGVAGFQSLEAGKFATAIMVGALLVQWRRSEQRRAAAFRWSNRFFFVVVVAFATLLFAVPYLRSDYSPLIVVVTTIATLLARRTGHGENGWLPRRRRNRIRPHPSPLPSAIARATRADFEMAAYRPEAGIFTALMGLAAFRSSHSTVSSSSTASCWQWRLIECMELAEQSHQRA